MLWAFRGMAWGEGLAFDTARKQRCTLDKLPWLAVAWLRRASFPTPRPLGC